MALAHVASAVTNSTTGTTTDTITIPASVAAGHDLYTMAVIRGVSTITCTDNDTGGNTWATVGSGPDGTITLFWKKATSGTASKTVTITGSAPTESITGGLSAFSGGMASGDPTTNLNFETNASGNEVHAGFTPTTPGSMIAFMVGHFTPANVVTLMACTDPGSMEPELWERSSTGGLDVYGIFTARLQPAGPTATGSFTWSQTNASTRSMVFAIQPQLNTGTGAVTLAGVTSAGAGVYGSVTGTGASTLAGVTSTGMGTFMQAITGTGSSTLTGVSSAGTGVFAGAGSGGGNRMGTGRAIRKPPRLTRRRRR